MRKSRVWGTPISCMLDNQ